MHTITQTIHRADLGLMVHVHGRRLTARIIHTGGTDTTFSFSFSLSLSLLLGPRYASGGLSDLSAHRIPSSHPLQSRPEQSAERRHVRPARWHRAPAYQSRTDSLQGKGPCATGGADSIKSQHSGNPSGPDELRRQEPLSFVRPFLE